MKEDIKVIAGGLCMVGIVYLAIAWPVFQWRNPLANKMSFFRDFADVVTWQKLPGYQPLP